MACSRRAQLTLPPAQAYMLLANAPMHRQVQLRPPDPKPVLLQHEMWEVKPDYATEVLMACAKEKLVVDEEKFCRAVTCA